MAGAPAAAAPTRYAGIQVQTSALGVQIPIVWGTGRCKTNLLDYLDFSSKAQKASTGKGGSPTTGYTYTATLILGICEGPIAGISQVWVDGKNYAHGSLGSNVADTGSTSAVAQAGLSLATGAVGQAVWSYLTTNHPDHAIGYSGLAYAYASNYALDSGAGTPQHSFEVVSNFTVAGLPDGNPKDILTDFFTNTRYGLPSWGAGLLDATSWGVYSTYCLAQNLLISPVLDQERQASDFLSEVMLATNSNLLWSEGLLKIIPYGDTAVTGNGSTYTPNLTPIYNLTDDNFVPQSDGTPAVLVDIMDQSNAYNIVQMEFLDRTNQYSSAIAPAQDLTNITLYGRRKEDPTTIHVVCDPKVAAVTASLHLQRTLYIRKQYKFSLPWNFGLLEPGDLVTLTHPAQGLNAYPVRIIEMDENQNQEGEGNNACFDVIAEDLLVGVSHAPLYGMQTGSGAQVNKNIDPGGVEANLLLWSQDYTNAAWTKTAMTVTAAATTNPVTGASDAQKLVPTAATASHQISQVGVAIFPNANYTYSAYLKASGYQYGLLRVVNGGGGNAINAFFDLTNGVLAASSVSGADTLVSTSIVAAGGGWYRCSITFQSPDTAKNCIVRTQPTAVLASFLGDGVSGCFCWGAQITQGLDVRPYAVTTTAASGPVIFNPPMALTPAGLQTWAALAGGVNWGGANIWVSYDGTNYSLVGTTAQGDARFGTLTASFASHADPDTSNTCSVDLSPSNGALTSASQATADAAGTLCLVDSELIGFEVATLINPNRYNLTTYIRRGMLGTAIASHSAGAPFIRLDQAIFAFPYNAQQAGRTATVKFQSVNQYGLGVTPLANCIPYTTVPVPLASTSPGSSAWAVSFTTISSGGVTQPVIVITGKSDNLSATGIEFYYKPTGTSVWAATGLCSPTTTRKIITGVNNSQAYDVGVAYQVGGVMTPIQLITGSGGSTGGGSSGVGTAVINDSSPGTHTAVVLPAGSYTHVDIVLTGYAGAGNGTGAGKSGFTDRGGGGANVVVVKGFPVTPGTTTLTYILAAVSGGTSSVSGTGITLTANGGTDATTGASGTGGANTGTNTATGSTSVTSYAGRNGGLTNIWDGGGPGATVVFNSSSTTVTNPGPDLTSDFTAGQIPGQGGAGQANSPNAGGGANMLVIART